MAERDFFHADKRGTIRALGRRPFAASLLIEIGKGGKGEKEILRSKRRCCEIHETRYALHALPLPAKERRKEERRRQKVRMPGLRPSFVRYNVHIIVIYKPFLDEQVVLARLICI